jgi:hypothetical protein
MNKKTLTIISVILISSLSVGVGLQLTDNSYAIPEPTETPIIITTPEPTPSLNPYDLTIAYKIFRITISDTVTEIINGTEIKECIEVPAVRIELSYRDIEHNISFKPSNIHLIYNGKEISDLKAGGVLPDKIRCLPQDFPNEIKYDGVFDTLFYSLNIPVNNFENYWASNPDFQIKYIGSNLNINWVEL